MKRNLLVRIVSHCERGHPDKSVVPLVGHCRLDSKKRRDVGFPSAAESFENLYQTENDFVSASTN